MKAEKPVPQEDLDKFLSMILDSAVGWIESEEKQHVPTIFTHKYDDEFKVVDAKVMVLAMGGRPPTRQIAELINLMLASRECDAAAFVTEAWTMQQKTGIRLPSDLSVHPDRVEALVVMMYTRQDELMSVSPIQRNPTHVVRCGFKNVELCGRLSIHGAKE